MNECMGGIEYTVNRSEHSDCNVNVSFLFGFIGSFHRLWLRGSQHTKWHLGDCKSRERVNSHRGRSKGNWMNPVRKGDFKVTWRNCARVLHTSGYVYRACNLMETQVPLDQKQIISKGHKVLLPAQQNNRLVANYSSSQADVPLVFKIRHRALVCYNYNLHATQLSVYKSWFWCYHMIIS